MCSSHSRIASRGYPCCNKMIFFWKPSFFCVDKRNRKKGLDLLWVCATQFMMCFLNGSNEKKRLLWVLKRSWAKSSHRAFSISTQSAVKKKKSSLAKEIYLSFLLWNDSWFMICTSFTMFLHSFHSLKVCFASFVYWKKKWIRAKTKQLSLWIYFFTIFQLFVWWN